MWSSLPTDVLNIIKDKLDIFDVASVNFVCRNWWLASKSYHQRHTAGNGLPWIMLTSVFKNTMEVIGIPKMKKITIDLPEVSNGSLLLFSKQGWVLIRLYKDSGCYQRIKDRLLLLSPFTREMIKLPQNVIVGTDKGHALPHLASFSVDNGRPHLVVVGEYDFSCASIKLKIAKVGDEMWTQHSYKMLKMRDCVLPHALLVIEQVIYSCYQCGKMVIYDTETREWKEADQCPEEIKNLMRTFSRTSYMDYNGQVICYGDNGLSDSDLFYSYNNPAGDWKRLSDDFKNDKTVFCSLFTGSFICSRQGGFKVYFDWDLKVLLADWNIDTNFVSSFGDAWVDIG